MRTSTSQQIIAKTEKPPKNNKCNVTDLSVFLAEREQQRQSLVHNLKGKFSSMKFSSDDLIKQRRAETLLEGH
jgi:hypothetical protein